MPCRDLLIYLRELNGQPTTLKWLFMDRYQNCQRVDVEWIHMLLTNSWYHIDPYQGTKNMFRVKSENFRRIISRVILGVFFWIRYIQKLNIFFQISKSSSKLSILSKNILRVSFWIYRIQRKTPRITLLMIILIFAQTGNFLAEKPTRFIAIFQFERFYTNHTLTI